MRLPRLVERLLKLGLRESAPRAITVTRLLDPAGDGQTHVPMIRLRGKWLREFGFNEGCTVRVAAAHGEIRLTVDEPTAPRLADQGELF